MTDLGPLGATILIVGILLLGGLLVLFVGDGPKEFFRSFLRGGRAVKERWRNYLLDVIGFFSLVAFALGLMVALIALGAVVYFLVFGPRHRLEDYRLYLPLVWTAFWFAMVVFCNSLSESLKKGGKTND